MKLEPYIFFKGDCQEAMNFYKNIFGGELEVVSYDTMPDDMPGKAEMAGKLMNAVLSGGDVVIRGSDTQQASPETKKVELCLTSDDEEKMRKVYDQLAEGGNAKYPLKKEFWGDIFGTLTDKFGVDWMIDITPKK